MDSIKNLFNVQKDYYNPPFQQVEYCFTDAEKFVLYLKKGFTTDHYFYSERTIQEMMLLRTKPIEELKMFEEAFNFLAHLDSKNVHLRDFNAKRLGYYSYKLEG